MVVLDRTSFSHDEFWYAAPKFCVLHSGDIVCTCVLIDARNDLLLMAVADVRYGMPHGENKENKGYSRRNFLNLQPNRIPWII